MKKIFLCLVGVFALNACSDDRDIAFSNDVKTKSDDPLMEMKLAVNTMMHSENYKTADGLIDAFITKMNIEVDDSVFEDDETLLSWIETNLGETKFSSVQEAQADLKRIGVARDLCYTENQFIISAFPTLTDLEADEVVSYYIQVLISEDPAYETVVYDASCPCLNSLIACQRGALVKRIARSSMGGALANNISKFVSIERDFRADIRDCGKTFFGCMHAGGCE